MYGTPEGVAALVPRLAGTGGLFTDTTKPTSSQTERLMEQVSAQVDVILAREGFATPISVETVELSLAGFVEQEVAAICEGINGSGRFGPTTKAPHNKGRLSLWAMVMADVTDFVCDNAVGFEALGASRTGGRYSGISYRQHDDGGNQVEPLTQREAFDEVYVVWGSL